MIRYVERLVAVLFAFWIVAPAAAHDEAAMEAAIAALQEQMGAATQAMGELQAELAAQGDRIGVLEAAPAAGAWPFIPTAVSVDHAPGVPVKSIACAATLDTAADCPILELTGAFDVNTDPMSATAECPNGTHDGFTYTPATGFTGEDPCTYRITDGSNLTPEGPLTVTVAP